ncbi:hypothetical protein L917_20375 [Phytophthora nicotianae]|uniref:Uncharacterized protein n=1 Tax=Phytophthora nicotianae TaxID=4792 RepID=W2K177_PHYNI|nr:hypothetical protein L917_20375 [Phytophthora nicotianae]
MLPQICNAKVAVKVGEPQTHCRITHSSLEVTFTVAQEYTVLRERLKRQVVNESCITWDAESRLYVKATVNARQRDYKHVPEENEAFYQFFSSNWSNPKRQDHRFYMFLCAIESRKPMQSIELQRPLYTKHLRALAKYRRFATGASITRLLGYCTARQSDDAPVVQLDSETYRQLRYADIQAQ